MSRIDGNRQESTGVECASVARSSNRQLPVGVQIACEAPLVATRFPSIPADSCRLGSGTTWQPSRLHQPTHVDSPRPARPPIWACPNPVAASHPARGISLRNVPKRNPTCATVSPYRAPRTCGPARRRDGSSRQARAEPRASRIDRNRQESTGVECVRAGPSRTRDYAAERFTTFKSRPNGKKSPHLRMFCGL